MSKPIPAEELEAVFEGKVRGLGGRANPWVPLDHPLKLTKAAG
jgi:hypothetical protein